MIYKLWRIPCCRALLPMGLLISKWPKQIEITNYPGGNVPAFQLFEGCMVVHMQLHGCCVQNLSDHVLPYVARCNPDLRCAAVTANFVARLAKTIANSGSIHSNFFGHSWMRSLISSARRLLGMVTRAR